MMKVSTNRVLIFLLVFSSLVPGIGFKISTLGFNWTFYRMSVLICILIYLQMPNKTEKLITRQYYYRWNALLFGWLIYGIILMALSPYRDLHNGFVELLSIFNGAMCIYILVSAIRKTEDLDLIVSIIFWIYIVLVVFGIYETLTGFHLQVSKFSDQSAIYLANETKYATGIFYAENDFCAFLTCFCPIMIYKKRRCLLGVFGIIGTIYINFVNDANICTIAMLVGAVFYIVFIKQYGRRAQRIMRLGVGGMFIIAAIAIWNNIDTLSANNTLLYVIRIQQLNFGRSQGSLYHRIMMYKDSLQAAFDTFFIGTGSASFSNYFISHTSVSGLVNPHNLYLEVLVEYGLIIMISFAVGIFKLIIVIRKKLLRNYDKSTRWRLISGCEMLVIYSIACLAPSSFLGYAWQWILITIGILLSGMPEHKGVR